MRTNDSLAPVALFVFNRPELTKQIYERVRAMQPGRLLVIADGPRRDRLGEAELCAAARAVVTSPDWPCELSTNFSEQNLGCKARLASGLDWVFKECKSAIILEDDCLPGRDFFTFCTEMLVRYEDDARIMHISGDNFQDGLQRGTGSYYFSRYPLSWGWASWRRAWQYYDRDIATWPAAHRDGWLETTLSNPHEISYWEMIFDQLYRGRIDTWDYQWVYACWRQGALSIHPNKNLVSNIGAGPDATHFREAHSTMGIPICELGNIVHPAKVIRDSRADRYIFEHHIYQGSTDTWFRKLKYLLALNARVKRLKKRVGYQVIGTR